MGFMLGIPFGFGGGIKPKWGYNEKIEYYFHPFITSPKFAEWIIRFYTFWDVTTLILYLFQIQKFRKFKQNENESNQNI